MPAAIRASGLPSTEDFQAGLRLFMRGRGRRWPLLIVAGSILIGAMALLWDAGVKEVPYGVLGAMAVVWLGARAYRNFVLRQSLVKLAGLRDLDEWTFSPSHARYDFGGSYVAMDWRHFERVLADDERIVLMASSHGFYCIPVRFFRSPADFSTLLGWAGAAGVAVRDFRNGAEW